VALVIFGHDGQQWQTLAQESASILRMMRSHIPDPSGLLLIYGLGSVLGNWLGGYAVDRYGSTRPIVLGLIVLMLTFVTLPIVATSMVGTAIALGIWGTAGLVLFAPQQHRLISLAPTIPTILIALNSSMIYLGIAAGAGVGSLVLASAPVSTLSLVATVFILAALLVFWFSTHMVIVPLSEKPEGAATSSNAAGNSSGETQYQMIRRSSDY
jgi:MFS transporter, DHA1 family, inner membrane transport protein